MSDLALVGPVDVVDRPRAHAKHAGFGRRLDLEARAPAVVEPHLPASKAMVVRTAMRPFDDDESWRRYLADLRRLPVAAPVRRRALADRTIMLGAVLRNGRRGGRRHGGTARRLPPNSPGVP